MSKLGTLERKYFANHATTELKILEGYVREILEGMEASDYFIKKNIELLNDHEQNVRDEAGLAVQYHAERIVELKNALSYINNYIYSR